MQGVVWVSYLQYIDNSVPRVFCNGIDFLSSWRGRGGGGRHVIHDIRSITVGKGGLHFALSLACHWLTDRTHGCLLLWMWKSCLHVAHIFLHVGYPLPSPTPAWSRRKGRGQIWWLAIADGWKGSQFWCKFNCIKIQWNRVGGALLIGALCIYKENTDCSLSGIGKMYEIWKQFNQIWLYLSLIQDILCVRLNAAIFLYVIRTCSKRWLRSFLSFSNKEQLPQIMSIYCLCVAYTCLYHICYIINPDIILLVKYI